MNEMITWRIYYADGSTFSNLDGRVWQAPGVYAQAIVQVDDAHGFAIVSHHDYYVWDDKGGGYKWWGADWAGLMIYLMTSGPKKVVFGSWIERNEFMKVFKRASNDSDFPPKTGYNPEEYKG